MAAFYSFAISIPAIFGACLLELGDAQISESEMSSYVVGAITAFVVGYVSLSLLQFIFTRKVKLTYFSYYLWALAGILIIFS